MLRPEEFAVGSFPEADADKLTLMLPRRGSEETILIAGAAGGKIAVYLGQHKYNACPCGDSDAWKGLLIRGVSIELDEASVFDPGHEDPPLGSLVREGTGLGIIAKIVDSHHIDRAEPVVLVGGLPACRDRNSAGFRKWQIILGEDADKRVLASIDVTPGSSIEVNR